MRKWIKATKNAYLVMYGDKCVKRFKWKTDAEMFLGRLYNNTPVVVERQVIAHFQENNEPLPNYLYRIVRAVMVRGSELMYPTNELFVTIERARKMCDYMNADPRKRLNERYKIATICQ